MKRRKMSACLPTSRAVCRNNNKIVHLDYGNDLSSQKPAAGCSLSTVLLIAAIYLVNLSSCSAGAAHRSASFDPMIIRHPSQPTRQAGSFGARVRFFAPTDLLGPKPNEASFYHRDGAEVHSAASEMDTGEPAAASQQYSGESDDERAAAAGSEDVPRAGEAGEDVGGGNGNGADEDDSTSTSADSSQQEAADNSQNPFMERHRSQLQAMQDLFERRQLAAPVHQHQHHQQQVPASQELSPISIGLDAPFGMSPFGAVAHDGVGQPPKVMGPEGPLDGAMGPGPLPFGLNPLPHLLSFPGAPNFDGPQRGDQPAHSNSHSTMVQGSDTDQSASVGGAAGSQKIWPKIFRFTDGRINLSDFEKQKKIRLSNKHNSENHIETPPIMFDNRPLKRKSFLILHGGIFSR